MPRRKFTREFKVSAVGLVNQQGYTVASAAKSLGVDPTSMRGWVSQYSSEPGMAPAGEGAVAVELARLRKENARLQMERDILKKAAAFFAKASAVSSAERDHAVMESFWATLKNERVNHEHYATHEAARQSIFEYIEIFYNRKRLHSSLDYVSPETFLASLN